MKKLKLYLIHFAIRLGIGAFLALIGIVVSLVKHDWNVSMTWFGGLGLLIMCLPAFLNPSARGNSRIVMVSPRMMKDVMDEKNRILSTGITLFCVGLPLILTSILVYFLLY